MADKRSIFEEVASDSKPEDHAPALPRASRTDARGAIRVWLHVLLLLVALMIVVGGLTRLTDSGLSITEWKPVTGAWPPTSEAVWLEEFAKYQASPEYVNQNSGMTLAAFKQIYWWEWGHRLLGRIVGLVWAAGFVWFLARRQIPTGWTGRLFVLGVLGGLQGAIGWWMVSSGLEGQRVDVLSYRLATHLGLAFLIMGLITWYSMKLKRRAQDILQARRSRDVPLGRLGGVLVGILFVQILLGALVAGIDAGRNYVDWPLMAGEFLPSESFDLVPLWTNAFENPALVQFNHRLVGYLFVLVAVFAWLQSRRSALVAVRGAFSVMLAMVGLQLLLGITTVLYAAPVGIAIVHQIGAIILMALVLRARFAALYPAAQSVRG
jgi:cytochrome c oxidase assembly protein subunit 15